MGIEVSWDNAEKTLLRFDFSGNWTLKEFTDGTQIAHTMIDKTPHQGAVASLLLMGEKFYTPPNLFSFAKDRAAHKHPRTVVVMLITGSGFMTMMLRTLFKLYPDLKNFYGQAKTIQEGRKIAADRIDQQDKQ